MNEILKKVYTVEKDGINLYFVFAKNAKKESKTYKFEEIKEDDFLNGIESNTFIDGAEWMLKNKEKVQAVKNGDAEKNNIELSEFKGLYDELKKELEELKKQNESLKKGKLKLSFADAEKLYQKKAELLRQLRKYEAKKKAFLNLELNPDAEDVLNFDNVYLTFTWKEKDRYGDGNAVLKTSSQIVINEFIPFIINKLDNKINELQKDVETIDI